MLTRPETLCLAPRGSHPIVHDWYALARRDLRRARKQQAAGDLAAFLHCLNDFRAARRIAREKREALTGRRRQLDQKRAENRAEVRDRASQVLRILEACGEELERLEQVPTGELADLDALTMAKGFVQRARAALGGRFQ